MTFFVYSANIPIEKTSHAFQPQLLDKKVCEKIKLRVSTYLKSSSCKDAYRDPKFSVSLNFVLGRPRYFGYDVNISEIAYPLSLYAISI